MARPLDRGEQPEMAPNQSFAPTSQPQFPRSQYSYPQVPNDYPIDTDLTMTDNFSQNRQQNLQSRLEEASLPAVTTGQLHSINVGNDTSITPGMAPPPQTPHQPHYSPTGPRTSIDDSPDPNSVGDGTKRKRSKVSRACDECRRKKVRCDAVADDGTLKTCTNCIKANLTCEYSRVPMKRGPSKGYIKELSERVQQVESLQMAMSGQPGYRQSIDSTSNAGTYPDPGFSPEEALSLNRHYSFPDSRNPFAPAEFHRDRMPSVGGWSLTSPTHPGLRPRDQGSLALAPDQQLPPVIYHEYSKPFWDDFEEPPPAKRRKVDEEAVEPIKLTSSHLSNYYRSIHPLFPLLPDADTTIDIIQNTQPKLQHCFAVVLGLFPSSHAPSEVNGQHEDSYSQPSTKLGDLATYVTNSTELSNLLRELAAELPSERSEDDNLTLIWICLLLAIQLDFDLARVKEGILSRSNLIKQAIDLATYSKSRNASQEGNMVKSQHKIASAIQTCWNCACILAKFHALSIGTGSYVSLQEYAVQTESLTTISTEAAFLARVSNVVALILPMIQDGSDTHSVFNIMSKKLTLRQHLGDCIAQTPNLNPNSPIVKQVRLFLELLLARYTSIPNPVDILQPAADLIDLLSTQTMASSPKASSIGSSSSGEVLYSPLDLHIFTLTTITLLEFLVDLHDPEMSNLAEDTLNTKLQPVLEQRAEQFHSLKAEMNAAFWQEETASTNTAVGDGETGHVNNTNSAAAAGTTSEKSHWSDYLLAMIDERRKLGWASTANKKSIASNASSAGATAAIVSSTSEDRDNVDITSAPNPAVAAGGVTSGRPPVDPTVILLDFSKLLRRGYLNVLVR